MMARCTGAAAVRARWTARSLAGAFLDLALAWAFLCAAAFAAFAARLLAPLGLPLPCTCARPHLPCLLAFLARYPSRAIGSLHASLRSRFPFAGPATTSSSEAEEEEESATDGDLRRELAEARAELQRELEKERSASASATEEAMVMILRLQKDKSALEIESRQHRRTAEERCAFYEDEVEELRDIVVTREREARALRKEVDAYRRLLGLASEEEEEEEEDEEEMVTPQSILLEGQPSSSKSVDTNWGNGGIAQLGNDSGFSFKTLFFRDELLKPVHADHAIVNGENEDRLSLQTPGKVPVLGSKLELDSCDDDGTETVEILPLSARSLGFDQGGDFHVDPAAGTEVTDERTADGFQEAECGGMEATGLIVRSFSDAAMQADKLQTRAAADDVLGKSLNAIKGAQDKIRLAASERRQSLQLQLLEDIADQLQEIKDAAEAGWHLYCGSPKISKKN